MLSPEKQFISSAVYHGTDVQAPRLDKRLDARAVLRHDLEIVLERNRLGIGHKGVLRDLFHDLEKIVKKNLRLSGAYVGHRASIRGRDEYWG